MNFCSNCGAKNTLKANFCSNCGSALSNNTVNNKQSSNNIFNSSSNSILGTLVSLQLLNGLTKNAYEKNGNYYSDKGCHHKINPATIMSVMGRSSDDTIDAMSLSGNKVDIETLHRNQIAKMHMNAFNKRNKRF